MKRTAIIFFLISTMLLPIENRIKKEVDYLKAFQNCGIEFVKYDISCSAKFNSLCSSKDDMESLAQDILKYAFQDYKIDESIYEDANKKLCTKAEVNGGYANIIISVENYCGTAVLNVTRYDGLENINDIRERMYNALRQLDSKPSVNLCMTGCVEGKLPESREHLILNEIISSFNGKIVDSVSSNGLVSICGYSRYIPDYVNYLNDRVNFNIASRYSSFDDRTYFWIGTPIINIEY